MNNFLTVESIERNGSAGSSRSGSAGSHNSRSGSGRGRKFQGKRLISVSPVPTPDVSPRTPEHLKDFGNFRIDDHDVLVHASELRPICILGRGGFGTVEKMIHDKSGIELAVKRITYNLDSQEQKRVQIEEDVSKRTKGCSYTVKFYGALYWNGDVWICMEVMDISLDKFYRLAHDLRGIIPEEVLGKIAASVVKALDFLKQELRVMHRDIKPSNILLDRKGNVKICDFGIAGQLVDSLAQSNVGSKLYLAPERIDPDRSDKGGFNIKSDVWSFGLTMMEVATGIYPYSKWENPFQQMNQVVREAPPTLPKGKFSHDFEDMITKCLEKVVKLRPSFQDLIHHPFITGSEESVIDMAAYISDILDSKDKAAEQV